MKKLKVCVVTGSRADFGLLEPVLSAIQESQDLELQLLAVGSHFLHGSDRSITEIESVGWRIQEWVEINYDDTPGGMTNAMAGTMIGVTDALQKLLPDIVLVLGDRFEILASVLSATALRIPIAHIAGGDVTEGAFDEGFRHAITKLAHVHFPTNHQSSYRLMQLGEEPWRIHCVGSPGIDAILSTRRLSMEEVELAIGMNLRKVNVLVTLHPTTLAPGAGTRDAQALTAALEKLDPNIGVIITGSNIDAESSEIESELKGFVARHADRSIYRRSLGHRLYVSLLSVVDAVIGNSSSGLYEAPSLGTPTVDIGRRQMGRIRAESVIHCGFSEDEILSAVERALSNGRREVVNSYGDGHSAERIVKVLCALPGRQSLLSKVFVDRSDVPNA